MNRRTGTRHDRIDRGPDDQSQGWILLRDRPPSAAAVRSRILKALESGRPLRSPRAPKARSKSAERVAFRYRATKERLVLVRDRFAWTMTWKGVTAELYQWAKVETADKRTWIVEPPRSDSGDSHVLIPYPVRPSKPLKESLFSMWFGLLQDANSPAVSPVDSRRMITAARVGRALHEAVTEDDAAAEKIMAALDTIAGRYLKNRGEERWTTLEPDVRPYARERHVSQELVLAPDRPECLERMIEMWTHLLTEERVEGALVAARCIRDLRRTHHHALAAELEDLESAGRTAFEKIANVYDKARDELAAAEQPRELVGVVSRRSLAAMLVALGLPAKKTRSLFDYERATWERSVGKRPTRRPPRGPTAP